MGAAISKFTELSIKQPIRMTSTDMTTIADNIYETVERVW